jgi:glycosyltransferase involved in cell wall biosynthesis
VQKKLKQGEALFAEGKIEQAKKCFLKIFECDPQNKEALNNLGVIAFQGQQFENAIDYFDKSLKIDPFYKEAVLNYVYILKELNLTTEASSYLYKIIEANPNDKELKQLLNQIEMAQKPKIKLAVLCLPGLETFLGDIIDFLKTRYNVRTCYSSNNKDIEFAVHWANVVWLEWANEMAAYVTQNFPSLSEKQVICRVHSYEVLHGYLPRIKWSKINKAIFVVDHVLKIARELHPPISYQTESIVINNGLNMKKFQFKERKPGFNIGLVNSINHKKNPSMWIEIINQLVNIDNRYNLKIAGQLQELRYKYYLENIIKRLGLKDNIKFYGHVKDISKWFEREDINYFLTTSHFESFGYAIAEAMAMGYRPLIHAFPSAEEIWPEDCVFGCANELIQMLKDVENYDSLKYRRFVEKKYSLQEQLIKTDAVFDEIEAEISMDTSKSESICQREISVQKTMDIPIALGKYHKPEKNLIVTGIPRSGTSLFSTLLNSFDNAICLNEILYDVDSLPSSFAEIRQRIISREPVPNRYNESGKLTTDTQGSGADILEKVVRKGDENIVIGSKINIPYLNQINKILDYGYKVIAIVRDPLYTIGSWNSSKAAKIPEAHVTDDDMHPRWSKFKFTSSDKIERQAQIWNFYASLIWNLRDKIKLYTYELITSDPEWVINDVCDSLELEFPKYTLEMINQNIDARYPKIEEIKEAVKKYCPIKNVFAYSYLDYEDPDGIKKKYTGQKQSPANNSNNEHTEWSRKINYTRKPILSEKGIDRSHLVIAFGGIANQLYLPPFEFFQATNSLPYSKILVRDFNQGWYHLGIDKRLDNFKAVLEKLRKTVEELAPETICTVGTSAGGYAAIVFGHFLKANFVHSLAPQTFIDQNNRERIGEIRWQKDISKIYEMQPDSSWFYDLRELLKQYNGKTVYNIHVSRNHSLDMAYAQHMENIPGINIFKYDCAEHNIAKYIKEQNLLGDLLLKPILINGKALSGFTRNTPFNSIQQEESQKSLINSG